MNHIANIYYSFINLGVFSRLLLVIVKPLALWLSIQLDSDEGIALAQIYLVGLFFLSISGTNAHRSFYQKNFAVQKNLNSTSIARSYLDYIQKITLQLIFVIIIATLIAFIALRGSIEVAMIGILFGIAEKLNDEFQRYAQFINNSKQLFYLALSKLIPVLAAMALSYAGIIDLRLVFPIFLLIGSLLINRSTCYIAFSYILKLSRKSIFDMFKMSFNHVKKDILQIGCVFMGMSLISLDKWLVQYFFTVQLPSYMLFTQIASIFILVQTIIVIAPVRARLVNENPQEINTIKIGSPLISLIPLIIGTVLFSYSYMLGEQMNIGYFAFFFASIVTFTVSYIERLYWVTTSGIRLTLDSAIFFSVILLIAAVSVFNLSTNIIFMSLGLLFCFMCLRLLLIIYLLNKIKNKNS